MHVSVMVPVYNRADLIGYTLDSILAQSHTDFDLTVIDDASADATVKIVENYCKDPRVRVIRNRENLGLTKNWNRCLELAHGPLVQIMQSDDLIDADYLERVDRIFVKNPEVGFVAANCRYIDINGEQIIPFTEDKPDCLYRAGDEAVSALLMGGFPHVSSIIVKMAVIEQVGKINEQIWHGPDVEYDARMASRFDYYRVGKVCTSFRRHSTNIGQLEYFRRDFLSTHIHKIKQVLSYISDEGLRKLGIKDLSRYINFDAAQVAIGGAIIMVAYGRFDLARFYLKKAVELYPACMFKFRFVKAAVLNILPKTGQKIMMKRLKISVHDLAIIKNSKLQ